jgi:tRNA nucleotidyltransferase (CCA-adding enzyme)
MKMMVPLQAQFILQQLKLSGFDAYVVGGFVRDHILGLESKDIDLSTSASPDQIIDVFSKYAKSEIGKEHGTIGVKIDDLWIEITTFRVDLEYHKHRKPKGVIFTLDLKEDVLRRDFTINALAMDEEGQVLDFVGGIKDLEDRCLRTVGPAHERFKEDALRILRALRFAARLDFKIEEETQRAIHEDRNLLLRLASERIFDELTKLLDAHKVSRIIQENLDVIGLVIPEAFHSHHLDKMDFVHSKLRWLILFEGSSIDSILNRLKVLKTSNAFKKDMYSSLMCIRENAFDTDIECKLRLKLYGFEAVKTSIEYYDLVLNDPQSMHMQALLKSVIETKACYQLKDLAINGQDCLRLGLKGESIKTYLNQILLEVIYNRLENKHEALIGYLKNHLS